MDKIEKFLKTLQKKDREAFLLLMLQLKKDFIKVPGLKKLRGLKNFYSLRLGRYRLVFKKLKNKEVEIIRITKRDEQTYQDL